MIALKVLQRIYDPRSDWKVGSGDGKGFFLYKQRAVSYYVVESRNIGRNSDLFYWDCVEANGIYSVCQTLYEC